MTKEDWRELDEIHYGYPVHKVREFRTKLRELCNKVGLIHIAEKRWAGQEFNEEIHADSETYTDRFIELIVSEYIRGLKDKC